MKGNTACVFFPPLCVRASVTHSHLFADKAVRPRSVGVGKQLGQARFSLLLHSIAVGHSEQVDPVAIQGVAQQLSMVIQTARFAGRTAGGAGQESVGGKVRGKKIYKVQKKKNLRCKRDTHFR